MSPSSFLQRLPAFFPGIVTSRFYETWDFYTALLGFRTLAECNTYVHLQHPAGPQLSILRHEVDGHPSELICATEGRGLWFNLEVADLEAEYLRLAAAGAAVVTPPVTQPWGDRQFVLRDPNGVLIYFTQSSQAHVPVMDMAGVGT